MKNAIIDFLKLIGEIVSFALVTLSLTTVAVTLAIITGSMP